ncbi:MAG: putative toxin-antitoxin system toxin component, PIN family [Nitrospirae bacterium]|nr:putative toxin-antitoxin system toxin component, PIN family [Nitrospirota bacterium]
MASIRAVIDTNIWVSSLLNPYGFPARLRKLFEEGIFHVSTSEPLIEELIDVLNRPRIKIKFEISDADIAELLVLLEERTEHVAVTGDIAVCRDIDDDLVIETAVKGHATYLVTRDDDIKFDKEISLYLSRHGISVLSISKFLSLIDKT